MKIYELVCAFTVKEGQNASSIEGVQSILKNFQAEIQSEEDLGVRELAYEIGKETRGCYRLFNIELERNKLPKLEDALKLQKGLLRHLFVLKAKESIR
ncbi:hypothetical protein JY97_12355 [Alkalispirochaeta odontotermitis]|uniref:30S ribosomal protein S6 n=1 Tax=Olavius algarvensis spirochete endosymbiont TaxID=260710 RepID=UPI00052BE157|nr:30S ribosomal protein S6 [Olavius algarvensis spirochete endosymbiont]KGM42669.1 hypothetical protein JY97_12355 [Alkalispirochaeta odontotermitis]